MSKLIAAAALAGSLAGTAVAAPLDGSAAIQAGQVTASAPLAAGTTVTFSNNNVYNNPLSGDFAGLLGQVISDFTFTLTVGAAVSFTSAFGNFSGIVTTVNLSMPSFANVEVAGIFNVLNPPPDDNALTVRLTVTEIGLAPNFTYSGGGVLFATGGGGGNEIPAPMSLALFGLGLAGLGAATRRKGDQAAA